MTNTDLSLWQRSELLISSCNVSLQSQSAWAWAWAQGEAPSWESQTIPCSVPGKARTNSGNEKWSWIWSAGGHGRELYSTGKAQADSALMQQLIYCCANWIMHETFHLRLLNFLYGLCPSSGRTVINLFQLTLSAYTETFWMSSSETWNGDCTLSEFCSDLASI